MGNGNQNIADPNAVGVAAGRAMQDHIGLPAGSDQNLDIGPADVLGETRSQDLHDGFLRSPTAGEMLSEFATWLAVGYLAGSEGSLQKMVAMIGDHFDDPVHFDDVSTQSHNHNPASCSRHRC